MKKKKRGQIQISFGMIFSIIIIIATLAVAFFVITHFLNLSGCTKTSLFWNSLKGEVDKAWGGDFTQEVYSADLPSGITKVCFGNFTQMPYDEDKALFEELEMYEKSGRNSYLYPPEKACEGLAFYNLEHIVTDKFFCVPVKSGKMSVKLSKTSLDVFVKLSKP